MLLVPSRLQILDRANHFVLPGRRPGVAFIADFPKDVVKVPDGLHNFANVSLLQSGHCRVQQRVYFLSLTIAIRIAIYTVDVVVTVEGMPSPGISDLFSLEFDAPSIEEHYGDID